MDEKTREQTQEMTIEEGFSRLEEIIRVLEDRATPLEEAFASWRCGMDILKQCSEKIDLVDKKVRVLSGEGVESEL